jgi:hypothetical protein
MDVMKCVGIPAALVVLTAGAAYAQDVRPSASNDGPAAISMSLGDAASHAKVGTEPRSTQPTSDDEPEEKGTWDNIKRGFFAGLVVGGVVGVLLTAECGHPECGPLLPFAAGVGGAIGLGLDALIDRPCDAGSRADQRSAPRATGPRVMLRLKTSW